MRTTLYFPHVGKECKGMKTTKSILARLAAAETSVVIPLAAIAATVAAHVASATTLEFWSLGADATPETLDLSPTIDSSHVLHVWSSDSSTFSTCLPAFKGVPQNQNFTTERNSSALATFDAPRSLICDSDDLRTAAMLGNDFTFEGWFELSASDDIWLFGTRSSLGNGWYLKFTTDAGFILYCGKYYTLLSSGDKTRLRNRWTHVAFVWHHAGGDNGYGYCELFLDWELVATQSMTAAPTTTEKGSFYIGGRGASQSYQGGRFAVDCVRFSDTALSSDEFLRATDMVADTYVAPDNPDVVGFWRLDEDSVYANSVSGGLSMVASKTATVWTNDSAVTRIPNMEWSTWTMDGDNYDHGSVRLSGDASGNRLYVNAANGVSKYLSLTNDFTVEMWLNVPRVLPSSWAILAGVNTSDKPRWWVIIRNNQYMPMVQYETAYSIGDNLPFTNGEERCTLTADDVGKWRHHAIVFEKDRGAHGTLSIYIDGIYRGSREFTVDFPAASSEALAGYTFDIGGRIGSSCFNDLGVDLVRVTKRALGTNEFLNAASAYHPPAAATVTNRVVETKTAALVTNEFETASYVTFNRPFTVEGLVRIDEGATYPQKLAECKVSNGGWTLTATNSHEVLLKVMDGDGVTIAEKSFTLPKDDFTWWRHLEVTCNFGLWNIYVDKDFAGSVTNDSFAGTDALPMMTLGSESGKVQHQKWRIVNNALLPEDFDNVTVPGRGLMIIFR